MSSVQNTVQCCVHNALQCGQYSSVFTEQFSIHRTVQCAQCSAVRPVQCSVPSGGQYKTGFKHADSALNGGGLSDRVID